VPIYGVAITLSDVELSAEQSERVRPALDRVFGRDATIDVWTSGPYHLWRVIHTIQAPTMLDAAEGVIRMGAEARDAAGLLPGQAVGFSCQFRDLSHPIEQVLPPEKDSPSPR
jgi:hypothetical protein